MAKLKRWFFLLVSFFGKIGASNPSKERSLEKPKRQSKPVQEYAEFYFKGTILDQLGRYFAILKRMKKADPEAYALYRKIGGYILPEGREANWVSRYNLPAWWRDNRPSFGMVVYGSRSDIARIEKSGDSCFPFAIYFRKYEKESAPVEIQPAPQGHDIYVVTVYWDSTINRHKSGFPTEFAIALSPKGDMTVLKILQANRAVIYGHGRKGKNERFTIPRRDWDYHGFFKDWAAEHNDAVDSFLRGVFCAAASAFAAAGNSMIRVKARKGNIAAIFSVDILRTPYFFNDREVETGATGKKKRIFHIARTHMRTLADGRVIPIRTHFRGLREFFWNGYKIEITVPGRDSFSLAEFDVAAHDVEDDKDEDIDMGELGDILTAAEKRGVGAWRANG